MKSILLTASLLCYAHFFSLSQITLENTVLQESVVLEDLEVPWDMTWGSDGWIWFTELDGKISRYHPDTEVFELIHTVEDVYLFGFSAGMHSIVLHPDFLNTPYVFVHYTDSEETSKIVRFEYNAVSNSLENSIELPVEITGGPSHNGSRMLIVDELLYISIGDYYTNPDIAQEMNSNNGKVLRINLDGSVPSDNADPTSYVWTSGHRNPQGMCVGNGKIYSSEHGTFIDDEINIIEANRNYGWPEVEGICDLSVEIDFCTEQNVAEPIYSWTPSVAPSGLDYYGNALIPEWDNSLLVATLKDKELVQLKLNTEGNTVIEANTYLTGDYGRLRDVLVIPDGRIYICTSNHDYAGTPSPNDDVIIELKPEIMDNISEFGKETSDLTIYPNPINSGILKFNSPQLENSPYTIQIFDISGKLVFTSQQPFLQSLPIDNLKSGAYVFSIEQKEVRYNERFIVQAQE